MSSSTTMSSQTVYTGFWIDRSSSAPVGATITLASREAGYVISALAVLVGIAGERAWVLCAFYMHHRRSKGGKRDIFDVLLSVVLRNAGSAISSIGELWDVGAAWKGEEIAHRPRRRSMMLLSAPLAIWAVFSAAGVLSSYVGSTSYTANTVLLQSTVCGLPSLSDEGILASFDSIQKIANDSRLAKTYATNCYGSAGSSLQCDFYPQKALLYKTNIRAACPFGGAGRCLTGEQGATSFDSGFLDSHFDLGVNAPPQHRVKFRKMLTCSVVSTKNETRYRDDPVINVKNINIATVHLGPIRGHHASLPYTYVNNEWEWWHSVNPYTLTSAFYRLGQPADSGFQPLPDFNASNADSSFHFLAPNAVRYIGRTQDPFYVAENVWDGNGVSELKGKYYEPLYYWTTMGCADQYQLQDPNTQISTILSGINNLAFDTVGFNRHQLATITRLIEALKYSDTYSVVSGQGPQAVEASSLLNGLIGPQLPNNQWRSEIRAWFETGMANVQKLMVDFPNNSWAAGRTTEPIVYSPDAVPGLPSTHALQSQCSQQRVRNVGSYQNLSVLGLSITVFFCLLIIALSFSVKMSLSRTRPREPKGGRKRKEEEEDCEDYKRLEWDQNGKMNLTALALEGLGYLGWKSTGNGVPIPQHALDVGPPERGEDGLVRFALREASPEPQNDCSRQPESMTDPQVHRGDGNVGLPLLGHAN